MRNALRTPGWGPSRGVLALGLFVSCLNCIQIESSDRRSLPPGLARRACEPTTVRSPLPTRDYQTPTKKLSFEEYPLFEDDLDFEGLELVLDRQLERYRKRNMIGTIRFGQDIYPLAAVRDTLNRFHKLLQVARECRRHARDGSRCLSDFRTAMQQEFAVYSPELATSDPRFGEAEPTLFTGYYTVHLDVSLAPSAEFNVPIYAQPKDDWVSRAGRYPIDFQNVLQGKGLELFYAKNRFDVYLMQLEGGGRVSYRDSNGREVSTYVSYAGSNGRQWRFLSTQMLEQNWISDPAVPFQRDFIQHNPQLEKQIFSFCPSYVYFRRTTHPPEGSDMVPLTDNRSIATDRTQYGFKGVLSFVRTRRPVPLKSGEDKDIEMMPFSRFVLDQDTGGAIRGKARVDFYFGEGEYAELAANTLKQRGDIFFLMLKGRAVAP